MDRANTLPTNKHENDSRDLKRANVQDMFRVNPDRLHWYDTQLFG